MLPNKIRFSKRTWDTLLSIQGQTGLRPNVLSRYAFLRSLASEFDGSRGAHSSIGAHELPVSTVFGEHLYAYNLLLESRYGELDASDAGTAYANHIAHGATQLRGVESLLDFLHIAKE